MEEKNQFLGPCVCTTSKGIKLYHTATCVTLEKYAKEKDLLAISVYVAVEPDGRKQYLLLEAAQPIYASTMFEDIAAHLDIMHLSEVFQCQ